MQIIDRGQNLPLRQRYALGRSFKIGDEIVVIIEVEYPNWRQIQACQTQSMSDIIELDKIKNQNQK